MLGKRKRKWSALVDGNDADWESIPALATGTTTVQSVYASNDRSTLFLLAKGSDMDVSGQFYLNTDNDTTTGYQPPNWSMTNGVDYMLQNNRLYRYAGTGTNWSWQLVGPVQAEKHEHAVEAAVPLSSLLLSADVTIRIGYIKGGAAAATGKLPEENASLFPAAVLQLDYDGIAPSAPQSVMAIPVSASQIYLSWKASTDNVGVVGYHIYRDGIRIGTVTGTAYSDAGLSVSNAYTYCVTAYDGFGNESAHSLQTTAQPRTIESVPASTGDWMNVRDYLASYVAESHMNGQLYASYDMLVLSTSWRGTTTVTREKLIVLKTINPELFAIGYIGFGAWPLKYDENNNLLDIYFRDGNGNLVANPNYPTSYYIDARKPLFHQIMLEQYLPDMFAAGYDGVFLDSVGNSNIKNLAGTGIDLTPTAVGAAELIRDIKLTFPDKKLVMNGGEHLLKGDALDVRDVIDGTMIESYAATYASTQKNPDGTNKKWYHLIAEDSFRSLAQEKRKEQYNKIRFQYAPDGTVMRDTYCRGGRWVSGWPGAGSRVSRYERSEQPAVVGGFVMAGQRADAAMMDITLGANEYVE